MRVRAVAAEMQANALTTPEWLHANGVALVVSGYTVAAIPQLASAAKALDSTDAWNDYAAALLLDAHEQKNPARVIDALAAIETALRHDSRHSAALINRAVALEQLGLLHDSLAAWQSVRKHVPDVQAEASRNTRRLKQALMRDEDWASSVALLNRAIATHDDVGLRRIVGMFPKEARTWGEGVFTSNWASCIDRDDLSAAQSELDTARAVGKVLKETSGEVFLAESISVIDRATPAGQKAIARAYLRYRDGRIAHQNGQPLYAAECFRDSIRGFAQAGSPMEFLARYFLASALFSQAQTAEASRLLDALAAKRFEQKGYLALSGQIGWERGLCYLLRGSFSSALDTFEVSRDLFKQLNELPMAAAFEEFIAATLDFMGDEDQAWTSRAIALEALSRAGEHQRIITALETGTRSMLMRDDFERAQPLLDLALARAAALKDPIRTAEALMQRSLSETGRGQLKNAQRDAQAAGRWVSNITDPGARRQFAMEAKYVEAMAISTETPQRAMRLLTDALIAARTSDTPVYASKLLLSRGLVAKRFDKLAAERDFGVAIDIVEQQRNAITDLNQRAIILHTATEVFQAAIDIAIERRDYSNAFLLTERSRARAVLDRFAEQSNQPPSILSHDQIADALADDSAIVDYFTAGGVMYAFVLTANSFRVIQLPEGSGWMSLISPILKELTGVRQLVIVPDQRLNSIRFATLRDPLTRLRLVDRFGVTVSASASLAIRCSQRARSATTGPALVVASAAFDQHRYPGLPPLTSSTREAKSVAALYDDVSLIVGEDATPSRLEEQMPRAAIIHYAGHALALIRRPGDSILVLAPDAGPDLTASRIARLDLRRTQLVFISACRSGAPSAKNDGVQSLATAFLLAGVPAIVASADDVDDQLAARFATVFHAEYRTSRDASKAFQVALNALPQAPPSMTLIGGSRSIVH
jgi:tetratricopeptide (TPR) repeat protein